MSAPGGGRVLITLAILLVIGAVAAAFLVLGSPFDQRQLRLDERRVEDLNGIRANIDAYWRTHNRLPGTLADAGRGAPLFKDPETGEPYAYRVLGDRQYELCATFAREFTPDSPEFVSRFWPHPAGRHCFQLEPDAREGAVGGPTLRSAPTN